MADCEFCGSGDDVEAQDMGEGRVMLLCASCRAHIVAGEERDRETMAKESTNKWTLKRARESANVLLRRPGTDPLLVEILSDLLWVVDHQQDQLEQMYAWTKYTIEHTLVDHARGDGAVQINETCHQAIRDWHFTPSTETDAHKG